MPEGTSVGNVYLDLVVRDTLDEQVSKLSQKASASAEKSFQSVGQRAGQALGASLEKGFQPQTILQKLTAPLQKLSQKALNSFNPKGMEAAAAQAQRLNQRYQNVSNQIEYQKAKLAELQAAYTSWGDKSSLEAQRLSGQILNVKSSILTLEERLAALGPKAAAAAAAVPQQFSTWGALFKTAGTNMASGLVSMAKSGAVKAASLVSAAVKKTISLLGSLGKKALTAFGTATKSILGFNRNISSGGRGLQSFGSRLRSIVGGALIFNGISRALSSMTQYLGKALTSSNQMRQALANLKGAAATAASPIISALTPALAALANAAATVFSWLSRLFSLVTGKSVKSMQQAAASVGSYGSAAGGAADKVKELQKANNTLGFDELNVVSADEEDEGGSGGGGSGSGGITPNYGFEGTSPFLDSLTEAIKAGNYEQVGALFAEKINGALKKVPWEAIDGTVRGWADKIARTLNGFVEKLDWSLVGNTVGSGLNVGLHAADAFVDRFNWGNLGSGIANGLNGAVSSLDWSSLGRLLTDKLRICVEMLYAFVQTFDFSTLGVSLAQAVNAGWINVDWGMAAVGLSGLVTGLLDSLIAFIQSTDWSQVGADIGTFLVNIDWVGILGRVALAILAAGGALLDAVKGLFQSLAESCGDGFLGGLLQKLADLSEWLKENLVDPLVNGIKSLLGIHSPSTVFEDIGINLVLGLLSGLQSIWSRITGFFTEKLTAVKETFLRVWNDVRSNTFDTFEGIQNKIISVWENVKTSIKTKINSIISLMNGLLRGAESMVNRMIDILNGFSVDVPKWAQGVVGTDRFGFNLSHVTAPQIPLLAQGGYVGPNQPQLAMIGDNRREGEIVAPESKLAQAVAEGMNGAGGEEQRSLLRQIIALLQAILDKDESITIGDDVIGRAASRWQSRRGVRLGGETFADAY